MNQLDLKQKIILGTGALIVLGFILVLAGIIPGLKVPGEGGVTKITVWGVFDTTQTWEPLFDAYSGGDVAFEYKQIPFDDYESELLNAFANRAGPDIFLLHNAWLPAYKNKLAPMPQGADWMTYGEYRKLFPEAVSDDFTRDGASIYAVPLYMDTLALYYNKDLFNAAGMARPPETWSEFSRAVEDLTIIDINGNLVRSGAAMGTARNVNRSTDIFSLLMLQTFGDSTDLIDSTKPPTSQSNLTFSITENGEIFSPGVNALKFYTDFANPDLKTYTWNREQPYSVDAFIDGNTAMMMNYSHQIDTIRARAPELNFGIAPMPQPDDLILRGQEVHYSNYFGLGVSMLANKATQEAAWNFLTYMADRRAQSIYSQQSGRLPARLDMIRELREDPDLGVFADSAENIRTWYQPNSTNIETYFADMIESVIDGVLPREALERAEGQIQVLIRRAD